LPAIALRAHPNGAFCHHHSDIKQVIARFTEVKPYGLLMQAGTAAVTETDGTLDRLEAAARRLQALDEERRIEQERRDTLIVEARDMGASWRTIARRGLLSMSRCVAVVSGA